jgi:hypothetical protein
LTPNSRYSADAGASCSITRMMRPTNCTNGDKFLKMLKTAATARQRMVEPLSKFADLDDHVELVVFKLLHHAVGGGAAFAGMDVSGALAAAAVCFDDLPAMFKMFRKGTPAC